MASNLPQITRLPIPKSTFTDDGNPIHMQHFTYRVIELLAQSALNARYPRIGPTNLPMLI